MTELTEQPVSDHRELAGLGHASWRSSLRAATA